MQPRTATEERRADRYIALECAKIQAGWTDRERYDRGRWMYAAPMVCQAVRTSTVDEAARAA